MPVCFYNLPPAFFLYNIINSSQFYEIYKVNIS